MSATASASDPWSDYNVLWNAISAHTMDRLKQIIMGLNDECRAMIAKTGKKQELIDRIRKAIESIKSSHDVGRWQKARQIMYQVKTSGMYTPLKPAIASSSYTTTTSSVKTNGYHSTPPGLPGKYNTYGTPPRPSSGIPSYGQSTNSRANLAFKLSPFFRVEEHVSSVVEGPESMSNTDRRQATLTFNLTPEQQVKLRSDTSKYQLRLYCTSSSYHTPSAYRATSELCPVEFPPTCEIRVNGTALNANTKGLKKKPGTAPPCDLGKTVKFGAQNRVEMVYVNSNANQPNAGAKKYYMIVMLVEVTTVDQLVDRLKKGKYRDCASILTAMKKQATEDDDDIVVGPQKMSLRDSLTMLRVATPTRSTKCVHPSCFDATTWFTMMENTTTWQCPICDKVLDPDELFVDGYFESIINATPEDCDDVMVEADGEWHTADNKYASPAWKAAHPPKVETAPLKKRTPSPAAAKTSSAAVYVLEDSDDEDEGQVKRELSPSFRGFANGSFNSSFATLPPSSQTPVPPSRQTSKVIDLTLDSDDDEPASTPAPSRPVPVPASAPVTPAPRTLPLQMDHPLPSRPHMSPNDSLSSHQRPDKRKASSDDRDGMDGVWKRSRPADGMSASYTNGRSIPPPPHRPAYDPYPSTNRQDADLYHSSPPSHTRPAFPSSTSSTSQQANGANYRYGY